MKHPLRMLAKELGKIEASAILTPMMPLRRRSEPSLEVDIAFDSEYQNDIDWLISYQFSGRLAGDSTKLYTHVYILNQKGGISHQDFLNMVFDFLKKLGHEEVPKKLFLISYAAAAELRYIKNYQRVFKLRETHKGLGWESDFGDEIKVKAEIRYSGTWFQVIDLAGFYPSMHLRGVGDAVGYPKIDIGELAPDHTKQYWIEHMTELLEKHADVFDRYSRVDAEIALLGWEDLLRQWHPKGLDPHKYRTIPSLAMADFRLNWLKESPVLLRWEEQLRPHRLANEEWSKTSPRQPVFDGDLEARWMALEAYWGGYNVAFVRGQLHFSPGKAYFYDFISLYVASGILQPLPNANTKWIHGHDAAKDWQRLEGFIRAYFEFPKTAEYPNLPVMHDRFAKLTFPLHGTTTCTIAEARVALKLGATIKPEKVVGFFPTSSEIDHVFGRFLRSNLAEKNAAKKGSLGYYSYKLNMVAAIGKLAERSPNYSVQLVQELLKQGVSMDLVHQLWRSPTARKIFSSTNKKVGGAWMPEWASLILGKARSYAGLVVSNGCYHISTDGGVFPAESIQKALALPDIQAMEKVGSGFRAEGTASNPTGEVSDMFVVRTRMYGAWNNSEIVHHANHSVHLSGEKWDTMLKKGIAEHKIPAVSYEAMRLAKSKDVFFLGRATKHFDEINQTLALNWHWDNKRFEVSHMADPFTGGFSETRPWLILDDAIDVEYPRKPRGHRKRLYETEKDRKAAYRQRLKQRTIM